MYIIAICAKKAKAEWNSSFAVFVDTQSYNKLKYSRLVIHTHINTAAKKAACISKNPRIGKAKVYL